MAGKVNWCSRNSAVQNPSEFIQIYNPPLICVHSGLAHSMYPASSPKKHKGKLWVFEKPWKACAASLTVPQAASAVKELSRPCRSGILWVAQRKWFIPIWSPDFGPIWCIHSNRKTARISLQPSDYTAASSYKDDPFRTCQNFSENLASLVGLGNDFAVEVAGHPLRVSATRSKCRLTQSSSRPKCGVSYWSKLCPRCWGHIHTTGHRQRPKKFAQEKNRSKNDESSWRVSEGLDECKTRMAFQFQ